MSQTERETLRQRPPDSPVSQEMWDYLVAAGVQPATQPSNRVRRAVRQRPRWLAFLIRLFG
jgi:hypothetical protein